jgi:hypothetical protein
MQVQENCDVMGRQPRAASVGKLKNWQTVNNCKTRKGDKFKKSLEICHWKTFKSVK